MDCPVRSGLRADAVFLFTLARSLVRSIWKAPNHPTLESRSRTGLHRDGDGAHVELAFSWSNYFRNHDFKHSNRDGLHRRRHPERKASRRIWHDRRGIWDRIHVRASNWWIGRRLQSASRVLDCSRSQPNELALGLLLRSGIVAAKSAKKIRASASESGRLAYAVTLSSRTLEADNDPISGLSRAQCV